MRAAVVAGALCACYSPSIREGVPCAEGGRCPGSLRCIDNVCVSGEDVPDIDAPPACPASCNGMQLVDCNGAKTCAAGCSETNGAHCLRTVPSNGVDPALVDPLATSIVIDGLTTFDTDTGAITGAVMRAPGAGIDADIAYAQIGTLGVFGFSALAITGEVRFAGSRPVVLLSKTTIDVTNKIDASGGCYGTLRSCAVAGGGTGAAAANMPAQGCGAGTSGTTAANNGDGGGGGGGRATAGGEGGESNNEMVKGAAGPACPVDDLEPLVGGSGGGGGGPGGSMMYPFGGGGGGAIQLTAFEAITITGTIAVGGAGGAGGTGTDGNSPGGGGGGAGGAILLEAPSIQCSGILAANGGGGGGAGSTGSNGSPGQDGTLSTTPATGGAAANAGVGGAGGARGAMPGPGVASNNGGGGGGAAGVIVIRAATMGINGTISPAPRTPPFRAD